MSVRTLLLMAGLAASVTMAKAQEVNAWLGAGVAYDPSTHQQVNTFGDGVLYPTRDLGGFFTDFGLNVLFRKQVGVGFDIAWRDRPATYTGVAYRPSFYSFDALFQPTRFAGRRVTTELQAGIGGAHLSFSPDGQQPCVNGPACQSVQHFQIHSAVAVRIYLTRHVFVRPALDLHYVTGLSEFSSNFVPQYSVGIGYGAGRD